MKGYSTDSRHHEALRRIVALLLALAGLAEQAACRSWPVRRVVLWLLRPAERVARSFAAEVGCPAWPLFPVECLALGTDDGPSGAACLGWGLLLRKSAGGQAASSACFIASAVG